MLQNTTPALQENKLLVHTTWAGLKDFVWSERSQALESLLSDFICVKPPDKQNKSVVTDLRTAVPLGKEHEGAFLGDRIAPCLGDSSVGVTMSRSSASYHLR